MPNNPPVSQILKEMGIPHSVFVHKGNLHSLEQAAEERGQQPQQVVRSLLFRESRGSYLMVLVAGPEQIDWKKLRHQIGTSRITMASPSEVLQVTGDELGAVAPFGLPQDILILVDDSVLGQEVLSMSSGIRNVGVIIKRGDLLQALGNYEIVQLR